MVVVSSREPAGVVVANDANRSRAFLLAHTLKRMRTPAFLVICHDGRQVQARVCVQAEASVCRCLRWLPETLRATNCQCGTTECCAMYLALEMAH